MASPRFQRGDRVRAAGEEDGPVGIVRAVQRKDFPTQGGPSIPPGFFYTVELPTGRGQPVHEDALEPARTPQ